MSRRPPLTVRRIRATDWAKARDLRLEMLRDTPTAYLETYDAALRRTESQWQADARRDEAGSTSARFVAETADAAWVATMGCYVPSPGRAYVVAVYVTPAWRGRDRGVADLLLDAVDTWACDAAGATELRLHVHEHNARALAYYRRAGFVETGASMPYELGPSACEIEMARPCRSSVCDRGQPHEGVRT